MRRWFFLLVLLTGCEPKPAAQDNPAYPHVGFTVGHVQLGNGQHVEIMRASEIYAWIEPRKNDIKIVSLSVGDRSSSGDPNQIIVVWESTK